MILPVMAPFAVAVSMVAGFQIEAADRSNRELKRMANMDMAPVLTDCAETIDGRTANCNINANFVLRFSTENAKRMENCP